MTTCTPEPGSGHAAPSAGQDDRRARSRVGASASRWLSAAVAAATALTVLAAGSASAPAAAQDQPARASLTTKALFAKVHRAYLHVPAIELTAIPSKSTLRFPRRFVLILQSGVVVGEEFSRSGRDGTTLVARNFRATYARTAGTTCWRRLPASNPQTLTDVGIPYPYTRIRIKALQPKPTAFGWNVVSANRAEFWFLAVQPKAPPEPAHGYHQRFITYAINAKTYLIRYIHIVQPAAGHPQRTWPVATLKVTALTSAPQLPVPTPAC